MGNALTFADIFKGSFVRQAATNLTIADIAITLLLTLAIGLFIFFIYKKTFQGVLYTQGFNISLIILALVTSLVIMTITSNIVLSLGMVGALSIVRFRTAIKDPMDIVFMFWAISVGIINGAGFYVLAIAGSVFLGLILLVFTKVKIIDKPYLLIVNYENGLSENELLQVVKTSVRKYSVKSKTVSRDAVELTLEFRLKDGESEFVNKVSDFKGVRNAVLVSYNGDYVS